MKSFFRVIWLPALLFFLNLSPLALYLYITQPSFDVLMHLLGGAAIAFMFFQMQREYKFTWWDKIPVFWKFIFVSSFVLAFGVAWEWYEFLHDIIFKTHYQPSLADTMYDLLNDGIGAIIFLLLKFSKRK